MTILTFNEADLIPDVDIKIIKNIIKRYVDIDDPVFLYVMNISLLQMDKLNEVY